MGKDGKREERREVYGRGGKVKGEVGKGGD